MSPLVLIPGMMCDGRLFAPQIAFFNSIAVVIASITRHDTISDLATEIIQQAPSEFSLLGLSMGGIVAMEIVRQAPERVDRLCLMDTNPLAETKDRQAQRLTQMERLHNKGLKWLMQQEVIPNYRFNNQVNTIVEETCLEMAMGLGEEVFVRQSLALKNRPDQLQALSKFDRPSLILHGQYDRLCPTEKHQLMARAMPSAKYVTIAQAGHLCSLDNPTEVNWHLGNWKQQDWP